MKFLMLTLDIQQNGVHENVELSKGYEGDSLKSTFFKGKEIFT